MKQQETIETYLQAVAMYDAGLKFTPNHQKTLCRKAMVYESVD
ncbi:hypothetical protein [Fischerella sp. PCC 9605]|nr:hypothetical protein [Fischerella sp. PCC 9605]